MNTIARDKTEFEVIGNLRMLETPAVQIWEGPDIKGRFGFHRRVAKACHCL